MHHQILQFTTAARLVDHPPNYNRLTVLVRGTVFGHHVDPNGTIVLALARCDAPPTAPIEARTLCMEFPFEGQKVQVGTKVTYTPRGNRVIEPFRINDSLFNVITELPNENLGSDNQGFNTGSVSFPQQQSAASSEKNEESANPCGLATPGRTTLTEKALVGTNVLPVQCIEGFKVGDRVRINPGGSPTEAGIIAGFGSIILQQPIQSENGYLAGTVVILEPAPTSTATATGTATATPTPTSTVTSTIVPATSTATATQTSTVTVTSTTTSTPTSTPTNTPTNTPTSTPTNTPTSTSTPTPVTVAWSVETQTIVEGSGAGGTQTFVIAQLSAPVGSDVNVPYAINGSSTASNPADYTLSPTSPLTILSGNNTATLTVNIVPDYTDEPDETVVVDMGPPTGGGVVLGSPSTHTLTIADDDATPGISITDVSVTEPETTTPTTASFQVTLNHPSSGTITVDFATASPTGPGSATGGTDCSTVGTDYLSQTGTVSFAPGDFTKPVSITICGEFGDVDDEPETFRVNLINPSTNATIVDGQGIGTINQPPIGPIG